MPIRKTFGSSNFAMGGGGNDAPTVPVLTVINGSDEQQEHGIDMVKTITTTPRAEDICGAASLYVDGTTDFPDGLCVCRLATDGTIVFALNMNPYLPYMLYAGDRFISTSTVPVSGSTIAGSNPVQYYVFNAYIPEVII